MSSRFVQALKDPRKIAYHLRWRWGKMMVRKVRREGKQYFEYQGQLFPEHLAHGNAQSFIAEKAGQFCRGSGIDIGADRWPFSNARPIRNLPDENAYKLDSIPDASLDYVFSSHCLEHLDDWQGALTLWITKLRLDGVLFLYLPHKDMKLWNPGSPWVLAGHRWQPDIETLLPFLESRGMKIVENNPGHDDYWSFHIVARRTV